MTHTKGFMTNLFIICNVLIFSINVSFAAPVNKGPLEGQVKVIQSNLKKSGIASQTRNDTVDLCKGYDVFMPRKLCTKSMKIHRILSTNKLGMRKYGDIKAITEKSLRSASFKRVKDSVHTYDDGLYFYQCARWSHKNTNITLHVIGINEHPSVGWFFWSILSSTPCKISNEYKGFGYKTIIINNNTRRQTRNND
ncbi:MAG: hypothetical protein OEZ39_17080 [Gammaproteobacteria bacterium]|nr:hypothetical protein [Gammaproteobacteria bacterium]MDH5653576.1 hypothetical protein [Gammaproteobacteria bacterium]